MYNLVTQDIITEEEMESQIRTFDNSQLGTCDNPTLMTTDTVQLVSGYGGTFCFGGELKDFATTNTTGVVFSTPINGSAENNFISEIPFSLKSDFSGKINTLLGFRETTSDILEDTVAPTPNNVAPLYR